MSKKVLFKVSALLNLGLALSACADTSSSAEFLAISDPTKIVIAHRGASGYLPEHTLPAKVLAYAQGADYIEQDVVMTKDNKLVVFHDLYLERLTNVREIFPDRHREDQHYYIVDFLLSEIRQLKVSEEFIETDTGAESFYPQRFPVWQSSFSIHTLQEEIELIQGLNHSTGGNKGIYVELKSPWFFHQEGKDISTAVLSVLKEYGYTSKQSKAYVQTFDHNELKRVKTQLLPQLGMDIKLVQLIAENEWQETFELTPQGQLIDYDYDWMFSTQGMKELANYADGVGPNLPMIVKPNSTANNIQLSDLVKNAHAHNLAVHPYTFRKDEGRVPQYADSFEDLLKIFYVQANVDGVFTDFPDIVVSYLKNTNRRQSYND